MLSHWKSYYWKSVILTCQTGSPLQLGIADNFPLMHTTFLLPISFVWLLHENFATGPNTATPPCCGAGGSGQVLPKQKITY